MKSKNIVRFCIVALAVFVIGLGITGVAAAMGGRLSLAYFNSGFISSLKWDSDSIDDYDDHDDIYNNAFSYNDEDSITTLTINSSVSDIEIYQGANFSIQSSISEQYMKVSKEGTSITLDNTYGEDHYSSRDDVKTIITIPESVKDITIASNLGDIEITNVNVNTLHVHNDMGDIEVTNTTIAQASELSVSTGDIDYQGSFTSTLTIHVDMGDIDVNVQPANQYNFNVSTNMGEIEVDDYEYGTSYSQNNNANATLNASTNMGDIGIETSSFHHDD